MCSWKAVFTATLFASISASGQQTTDSQLPAQPTVQPTAAMAKPVDAQDTQPSSSATETAAPAQIQPAPLQQLAAVAAPTTMNDVVDLFIAREHALIKLLSNRTPVVEVYLQNLTSDPVLGPVPSADHYFLGRMDMGETADWKDDLKENNGGKAMPLMGSLQRLFKVQYQPLGFSWMVYADRTEFDREHYDFRYVRREFLGDVRCLVFDVAPKKSAGKGRFLGRIWVEDQAFNIVRLNGTYSSAPVNSVYFRMDSWRLNLIPGYWVPAYIYSDRGSAGAGIKESFKAQTRIWGYDLKRASNDDELTQIRVDSVTDEAVGARDASPLEAERVWQQQAEDRVIERLTDMGWLAPAGDVDRILQTVVNNLVVTNGIDLPRPVRTRLLLTAPLETFSVGNTIVISRGLVDVLPDEASLAAVLSHELAHIALGHNSKYVFNDDSMYRNLAFKHTPEEEQTADQKALEILKNSPYADKLDNASLFLKALQMRAPQLTALVAALVGNSLVEGGSVTRLPGLLHQGPPLDNNKLDQVAALPLGGRVKINPWDDRAEIVKTAPVAITSVHDKMPFEVTPFFPSLKRYDSASQPTTTAANTR